MLYYNIGSGTSTAGQAIGWIRFSAELPNLVLFMLVLCVLAPRLNSGRLAVVLVVKLQVIDVHCSVATVQVRQEDFLTVSFPTHFTHICLTLLNFLLLRHNFGCQMTPAEFYLSSDALVHLQISTEYLSKSCRTVGWMPCPASKS